MRLVQRLQAAAGNAAVTDLLTHPPMAGLTLQPIEDSAVVGPDEIRRRLDVLGDYLVYVGRIEREKGCSRLFEDFLRYVQEKAPHLNLVLVGKAVLPIPVR